MEIELIKIEDIKEYPNNAKKHPKEQIEQIKKSILDFGFNDPIGIDENNMIFEGHGRFKALQEMNVKEVPCIRITGLSEEQKKAYILAHNKLTMNTGFDSELLRKEIEAIKGIDLDLYDFEVFSSEEVEQIDIEEDANIRTTLEFSEDQFQEVMQAVEEIESKVKEFHSYGNPNKSSNLINEIIYEWGKSRKVI